VDILWPRWVARIGHFEGQVPVVSITVSPRSRQHRSQMPRRRCLRHLYVGLYTLFFRFLEHLECSHQPHIQGRGAEERTQRAG